MHAQHVPPAKTVVAISKPADEDDERGMILPFQFVDKNQYQNYRQRLWNRDPNCVYCKHKLKWMATTLDHIIPASKGGLNSPANLVLACQACNSAKDNRSMQEWAQDLISACATNGQTLDVECGGVS